MKKVFQRIAPTGNPIALKKSDSLPDFIEKRILLVQSGTAALAAALDIAKQNADSANTHAEVILPAYCCPDLISAVLYNDMKPVLVDLSPQTPYMDLGLLKNALSERTAAVIAVNFLGIPERLGEIRQLINSSKTLLIEDSAQWFPENDKAFSQHRGDLVIYSFGKGKPVCLLGGGALCIKNPALEQFSPRISSAKKNSHIKHIIKFIAYNAAISNYCYWLLELIPFMNLGITEYHPLELVQEMDKNRQCFIKTNVERYQNHIAKQQGAWKSSLTKLHEGEWDLTRHSKTYSDQRLLRYPILLPTKQAKNTLLHTSNNCGLGISPLYPESLPKIQGIPSGKLPNQSYPVASDFASRLATLPTHSGVSDSHIESTIEILKTLI